MKLALRTERKPYPGSYAWETCLPFVENKRGVLIHRPRQVVRYTHFRIPYLAVHYYCGNCTSGHGIFTFLAEPPQGKLVCEKCENAAVLNRLPSTDSLCGEHRHKGTIVPVRTCCKEMDDAI